MTKIMWHHKIEGFSFSFLGVFFPSHIPNFYVVTWMNFESLCPITVNMNVVIKAYENT